MTTYISNRRKQLLVDAPTQKRIVVSVTLLPTLALGATMLIVGLFCRRLIAEAENADVFLPSLVPLFISVLGFVVISGTIVVWCAFRFSHRIAGPSYRLVQACRQVRDGDLTVRVSLRDGDHLGEVADAFNATLQWLEENVPPATLPKSRAAAPAAAAPVPEPAPAAP
jgi:methyl-accepting chemotaxis protein